MAQASPDSRHPPKLRTVEEERNEAAREQTAVESSFSHEMVGPCLLGMKEGSFDSGETVLIKFQFSTQPIRIAARNVPDALACGAKLVSDEAAPIRMKETVNRHVAPRVHVIG